MNDFLVDELYKNAQKLRIKNQTQENMLHKVVEGHRGFKDTLNKNLSKLEKKRKIIEEEYLKMEREMKILGLSPPKRNSIKTKYENSSYDIPANQSIKGTETSSNYFQKSFNYRRASHNGVFRPQSTDKFLRRKFSFDSNDLNFLNSERSPSKSSRTNCSSLTLNITDTPLTERSLRFPVIKRSSTRINETHERRRNSSSIGKNELRQLEIPMLYKYSNIGYERYKSDPYSFLPNGSLKKKFSLPKLGETLELVKNCQYIRKNKDLIENSVDIKNIFNSLEVKLC